MPVSTVGTGKQFTTLAAWKAAKESSTGVEDAECYGIVGTGGVTFGPNWLPSSSNIYTAAGARCQLNLTGAKLTGGISMDMTGATPGGSITFDGLILDGASAAIIWMLSETAIARTLNIKNCVVDVAGGTDLDIETDEAGVTVNCINNVFLTTCNFWASGSGGIGPVVNFNLYYNFFAAGFNSTEIGSSILNITARNNMASAYGPIDRVNGALVASNNLSADGTADSVLGGANNLINKPLANQVIDAAANWRLKSTADARNAAIKLATVTTDALGTRRPIGAAPDMGPHEFGRPFGSRVRIGGTSRRTLRARSSPSY